MAVVCCETKSTEQAGAISEVLLEIELHACYVSASGIDRLTDLIRLRCVVRQLRVCHQFEHR